MSNRQRRRAHAKCGGKSTKSRSGSDRSWVPVVTPLTAAVVAALNPGGAVLAQEEEQTIEEIMVTGSRIRRDTFSSAAPMDTVVTETAATRGITDVATLLRSTTVAMGSPQMTSSISAAGSVDGSEPARGGLGTNSLSLRGLGANRTLVLLNGRRAGPSGVQGAVSSFDLNSIPLSAIDRVEILKDGASSIYGSDAVAGVVNIITKKDEGATFDAFISQPEQSGGEEYRLSGSWGKRFDRGYFRATADYHKTEILRRGDRDYFACDEDYVFEPGGSGKRADLIDPRTGEFFCDGTTWGHVWVYDYAADVGGAGDGTTNAGPPVFLLQYDFNGGLSGNNVPPLPPATNPNHMVTPPGWFPVSRGDPISNSVEDSDHPLHDTTTLVPDTEVVTLFLEGEYNVTDNVTAYSEVLLNRREIKDEGFRQIWTYIYNYDSADWGGFDGMTFPSDPFSAGWTGAQWLSPLAITDHDDQKVTVDYTRFVLGLKGEFQGAFLEGWNWDLSYQYSKSDGEYITDQVLEDSLQLPYFRTGSCVGEVSPISGKNCVDIQWLDPDFLNGNIPQDVKDFLFDTEVGTTEYEQWSVEGFVTGDLWEMPAGSAAGAFGFQLKDDEIIDTPGHIVLANNAWQADAAGITAGDDSTVAVFAEIDIPLVSGKPGIEFLDFNASVRYTDVDSFGSDTTYKVGANWAITDSFRARSTFGTSFRTPALFELHLADLTSFISARNADPCINWGSEVANGNISQRTADNCAADGIPADHIATVGPTVVTGGGQGLDAETSEAFTFGVIWQPAFADLSMSVDYFDILVEDEVDVIGAREIVAGCYESPFFPNEPLCSLFDRDPPSAALPNAITEIRDRFINVAKQQIRGIDFAAQWITDVGRIGTVTFDTQWTYNLEDTLANFVETEEDLAGEAGHPESVGRFGITLDRQAWSVNYNMNYIGRTDNFASFGRNTVSYVFGSDSTADGDTVEIDLIAESTTYHSLSAAYAFDNGLLLRAGVANLFDEEPPQLTAQGTGNEVTTLGRVAFYSQYDWLARRFFFNVTKEF